VTSVIAYEGMHLDEGLHAGRGGSHGSCRKAAAKSAPPAGSHRRASASAERDQASPDDEGFPVIGIVPLPVVSRRSGSCSRHYLRIAASRLCSSSTRPYHKSMLVDLLARDTAMNVLQAGNGMSIERNCLLCQPAAGRSFGSRTVCSDFRNAPPCAAVRACRSTFSCTP